MFVKIYYFGRNTRNRIKYSDIWKRLKITSILMDGKYYLGTLQY